MNERARPDPKPDPEPRLSPHQLTPQKYNVSYTLAGIAPLSGTVGTNSGLSCHSSAYKYARTASGSVSWSGPVPSPAVAPAAVINSVLLAGVGVVMGVGVLNGVLDVGGDEDEDE